MQSFILDSIKGNVAALQSLCFRTGSIALLLIWVAFQNKLETPFFGVTSSRDNVYLTAGLFFSVSNLAQALYYRRLAGLAKLVTNEDAEKAFYSIVLSPSLFNPFTVLAPRPGRIGTALVPFVAFLGLSCLWSLAIPYETALLRTVFLALVICAAVMVATMLLALWSVANLHAQLDPTMVPKARRTAVVWSAGGVIGAIAAIIVLDQLYYYA